MHSVDSSAARQGGDLGWLYPGDTVPEFERAMDALKPGEVSEPVQSPFGWHLIQVLERRIDDVAGRAQPPGRAAGAARAQGRRGATRSGCASCATAPTSSTGWRNEPAASAVRRRRARCGTACRRRSPDGGEPAGIGRATLAGRCASRSPSASRGARSRSRCGGARRRAGDSLGDAACCGHGAPRPAAAARSHVALAAGAGRAGPARRAQRALRAAHCSTAAIDGCLRGEFARAGAPRRCTRA
ncbi:MAG: peptidylprolyl isomerase [Comamonadaceae bacterium]|nr:peptidylprolyl isomerase [Comamonadaceae bacterium]